MEEFTQTFTLTFGDQGENHKGMQKIGKMSEKGFSLDDLLKMKARIGGQGEIYHLNKLLKGQKAENAYLLIIRNGVDLLMKKKNAADKLYEEQNNLEKDTKAFMYGRVVNKKARHNLCFSDVSQEPNYEKGQGRIIAYEDVPYLSKLRDSISKLSEKASNLIVEGNYYYDIEKCYIGYHGDSERRKVIGIRLGASFKFHYQWFGIPEYDKDETLKAKKKNSKARDRYTKQMIGPRLEIILNHGDLYVMSEKAVGTDWMSKNTVTLRHAAGEAKMLKGINKNKVDGKLIKLEEYKKDEEGFVIVKFRK